MSSLPFDTYSTYYDLLYADKDYDAEARYVAGLLKRHGIAGGRLLELGSGTGRHGRLLGQAGYSVKGIERSPEMVARAAQTDTFQCIGGDICATSLNETFDAVIALFHVVSYVVTNEDLADLFTRTSQHLGAGGLFVFDFWYTPAVLGQRPSVRVKRVSNDQIAITRIAEPVSEPNLNRVDVHYTLFIADLESRQITSFEEAHRMRHFSLPELDILASRHGFTRINAEEFGSGTAPGEDTWGVCVVLQKS